MSRILLAGLACALIAAPAVAQQTGGAGASLGGPQVAGVCLLSQQALVGGSKAGAAADTRLKQITAQVQAELSAERASIETDAKALEAKRASLAAADLHQRQAALNKRLQALQQKAGLRSREIEVTREKALGRILTEAQPVIAEAYAAHRCGLLVDRNAVLGGNMAGDLTPEVLRGLDARMTTITFDREILPAQPAG